MVFLLSTIVSVVRTVLNLIVCPEAEGSGVKGKQDDTRVTWRSPASKSGSPLLGPVLPCVVTSRRGRGTAKPSPRAALTSIRLVHHLQTQTHHLLPRVMERLLLSRPGLTQLESSPFSQLYLLLFFSRVTCSNRSTDIPTLQPISQRFPQSLTASACSLHTGISPVLK